MIKTQSMKRMELLRDKLLGPNRYDDFKGEQIGRIIQRYITDEMDALKTSEQPNQIGQVKKTRIAPVYFHCDSCRAKMRKTWAEVKGTKRINHYRCPKCGRTQTTEAKTKTKGI